MNTLFTFLTGDRASDLMRHSTTSRKKIMAIGGSLLLVSLVWFCTGLSLARNVLNLSWLWTGSIAAGLAFIVFQVDRSIILVHARNRLVIASRIALAILSAYLGGIALEQTIFNADIEQEITSWRQERLDTVESQVQGRFTEAHEQLLHDLAIAQVAYTESISELNDEMNGTQNGSGKRGYGRVAQMKAATAAGYQREIDRISVLIAKLDSNATVKKDMLVRSARDGMREGALLERMEALHRFLRVHPTAMYGVFLPMLVFMILLELIPLLLKTGASETAYEKELTLVETARIIQYRTLLDEQQRWHTRRIGMTPEVRSAEAFLSTLPRK